jgi:serine/threonine-protein kinase
VHRDLKPQNVFVVHSERGEELAKILDFGLVRLDRTNASMPAASLLGTVRYMAPEQVRNAALVDARADVYALGAVLYECLAGVPAHPGDTTEQILKRRLNEDPRSLGELRAPLPRGLDGVVRRALARNPNARFASASEFASTLERYLSPAAAREPEPHAVRGPSTAPVAIANHDDTPSGHSSLRAWLPHTFGVFAATGMAVGALWFAGSAHDDSLELRVALDPRVRTDDARSAPAAMTHAASTGAATATEAVSVTAPAASALEPERLLPIARTHVLKTKVAASAATGQALTPGLANTGSTSPAVVAPRATATKVTGRPLDHENPYAALESTR